MRGELFLFHSLIYFQKLFVAWGYQNFLYCKNLKKTIFFKNLSWKSFCRSVISSSWMSNNFQWKYILIFRRKVSTFFTSLLEAFSSLFLKVSSLSFVMLFNEFCWLVLSALLLSLQKCIWHFCIIFIERSLGEHYHFCICLSLAIFAMY